MSDLVQATVEEALPFAVELMAGIGVLIRTRRAAGFTVRIKPDGSAVTDADLAAEREIRSRIRERWPEHLIEGEEEGADSGESDFRWVIDPIDGTQSFRCGVPLYGSLLALTWREHPVVGVIHLPEQRRSYWAARGLGAFRDGERIDIADVSAEKLPDQIVALGDRKQFVRAGITSGFQAIMEGHSWARTYADCFGHSLVLDGSAAVMVDPAVHVWDVAATEVLIAEAGGRFERLPSHDPGRVHVVFGKPTAVQWALERLTDRGKTS